MARYRSKKIVRMELDSIFGPPTKPHYASLAPSHQPVVYSDEHVLDICRRIIHLTNPVDPHAVSEQHEDRHPPPPTSRFRVGQYEQSHQSGRMSTSTASSSAAQECAPPRPYSGRNKRPRQICTAEFCKDIASRPGRSGTQKQLIIGGISMGSGRPVPIAVTTLGNGKEPAYRIPSFPRKKPPPHVKRGVAKFFKGLYRKGNPASKFSTQKTLRLEREKRFQPRMGQKVSNGLKDMGMCSKVYMHGEWELC